MTDNLALVTYRLAFFQKFEKGAISIIIINVQYVATITLATMNVLSTYRHPLRNSIAKTTFHC